MSKIIKSCYTLDKFVAFFQAGIIGLGMDWTMDNVPIIPLTSHETHGLATKFFKLKMFFTLDKKRMQLTLVSTHTVVNVL